MERKRIFISHISRETELARALKQRLVQDFLGLVDVFVSSDGVSIGAGAEWLAEVERALRSADLLVVLCSAESVERPWVNFEAGAAWLGGVRVVPVCHSGLRVNDLQSPLNMLQAVELGRAEGLQRLYDAIATKLGATTPAADFARLAADLGEIERQYVRARAGIERITEPRILCAASEQYAEPAYGFHLDVAVLEKAFPGRVTVESKLTGKQLRDLLTTRHFDIVHLVLAVDPDTGDLVFSRIDVNTHKPVTQKPDTMAPERFAALLAASKTRLVVLATCRALLLAVEVAHVANMAASDADIMGVDAAEWEEYFYGLLASGRPLHEAFAMAKVQFDTPIRPVRHRDVAFAPEPA